MRRLFVLALVAGLTAASVDLGACGDKFLRVGRSARFRRYAAVHPASILIYAPVNSTRPGIEEFTATLKRAGHRALAIEHAIRVPDPVALGEYDIVIADYADAGQLRTELESIPSRPELLPILYKPTKAVEAEANQQYACLIKPHAMTKFDALAEIDRLMELKLARKSTTGTR